MFSRRQRVPLTTIYQGARDIAVTLMVKPIERVHPQAFASGARSCLWACALVQLDAMKWKRMLAYVAGSVDEELLARNEYLVTENRILRNQIRGGIRLTDPERISFTFLWE
jgi:hypothetical protein